MHLLKYIQKNIDSTATQEDLGFEAFPVSVKKGTVITDYGQQVDKGYFLIEGMIEVLFKSGEEERIIDFFVSEGFFAAYSAMLRKIPSDVKIKAITDCKMEFFYFKDLEKAYENSFLANKLGRIETGGLYLKRVQREKDFLTKSAEERYIELLENHPQIIQQLPINKIAKYLGIHPESLSRIRKKLTS